MASYWTEERHLLPPHAPPQTQGDQASASCWTFRAHVEQERLEGANEHLVEPPPLFPWRCQQVVCTSLGGGGGVGAKESKLLLGPNQSPPHNNSTVCARTCTCGGGRGAGVDKELLRGRKDDRCASGWSSFYKAGSSPNVKLLLQDRLLLHGLLYGPAHTNTQQFVSVFHCTLSKSLSLNPKQIAAANNIDYFARFSQ